MLTDAEVDSLARELLTKIIAHVEEWDYPLFEGVNVTPEGEPVPVYGATSADGLGSFRCELMPLDTVKTIIRDCERIFAGFKLHFTITDTGETLERKISETHPPESYAETIRMMAECATLHLVASYRSRLCTLLDETVKDCILIADSVLAAMVGRLLSTVEVEGVGDAREDIEEAAKRVADTKRALLRTSIRGLPHVIAERRPGAPGKSQAKRKQESEAYAIRVEDEYRKLRVESGTQPTKTSVATALGEGGVDARKGSDTRLAAFGGKLKRLEVDYDAIVRKVEEELNNNS